MNANFCRSRVEALGRSGRILEIVIFNVGHYSHRQSIRVNSFNIFMFLCSCFRSHTKHPLELYHGIIYRVHLFIFILSTSSTLTFAPILKWCELFSVSLHIMFGKLLRQSNATISRISQSSENISVRQRGKDSDRYNTSEQVFRILHSQHTHSALDYNFYKECMAIGMQQILGAESTASPETNYSEDEAPFINYRVIISNRTCISLLTNGCE